jgi:hypothetical protein
MNLERSERLAELLGNATLPQPDGAAARACAAAVAQAEDRWRAGRRIPLSPALAALIAAIALAGALLTPPGRAVADWVADVVGIGDSPTLEQEGSVPGSAVVIDSGALSDGTAYELVAKLVTPELLPGQSARESAATAGGSSEAEVKEFRFDADLICFTVDWPGITEKGAGGNCTRADGSLSPGGSAFQTPGLFRPPYRTDFSWEGSEPNVSSIFFGILNDPAIDRVEVVRRDQAGPTTQVAAKVITVSGALLERVGGTGPVRVFESLLDPHDMAALRDGSATIEAVALDDQGHELDRMDPFPEPGCDFRQLRRQALESKSPARPATRAEIARCFDRTSP